MGLFSRTKPEGPPRTSMFLGDDPRGPSKEIEFTWSGAPLDDESIRALATGLQFSFAWRADNGQLPMLPGTRDPAAQIGDWIGMLHEWWGRHRRRLHPHHGAKSAVGNAFPVLRSGPSARRRGARRRRPSDAPRQSPIAAPAVPGGRRSVPRPAAGVLHRRLPRVDPGAAGRRRGVTSSAICTGRRRRMCRRPSTTPRVGRRPWHAAWIPR